MTTRPAAVGPPEPPGPKPLRPAAAALDRVDRRLLALLAADARTTNQALADQVGVAPSTCLARVRALRERGAIRGFHADVDPAALGLDLQAMVAVRLAGHARAAAGTFVERLRGAPEVLDIYFVAGADDYLLHVAVPGTAELRDFVAEHLSRDPDVASTETSLIFEHTRALPRP